VTRSRIVENSVSLTVNGFCSLFFTVIQLGVLSRFLGGDLFGLFVSLRGFSLLLGAIVLIGLPQVLIRFLPSYQNRGRRGAAALLFLCSFSAILIIGGILYSGSRFWIGLIPGRIKELSSDPQTMRWLIIASVAVAAKMLVYGAFSGLREMKMQMILEFFYSLAFTAFIVARREALDVAVLFRAIGLLNALTFLVGVPLFFHLLLKLIPAARTPGGGGITLPALMPYWFGSLVLSFVALAFTDVDRFVMSLALPVSAISLFHIASRINFIMKRFLGIPILAAQPEITRVYEEGRADALTGKIRLFTKVALVSSFFLIGLFAVIGRDVIRLLSGDEFLYAYVVLVLLLPTVPIAAVSAPLLATMRSLHYMKWAILCDCLWMIFYFGSFFFLVRLIGVAGMAVSQCIAAIVQMLVAVRLAKGAGFYGGIGNRIGRALIALLVTAPLGLLVTHLGGLPASALIVLLAPFIGRFLVRRLGLLEPAERSEILDMIPVRFGKRVFGWLVPAEGR
jgi:O-antigen/teichoic acid export membrane protein